MKQSQSRRDWLKLAAGAALTAPLTPAFAEPMNGCSLAIGTYGLQSMTLAEAIKLVSKTGYDAIEITVFPEYSGDPDELDVKEREELQKLMSGEGLGLCALMADLHPTPDKAKHTEQTDRLKRYLDLGVGLSPEAPPLIQTVLGNKDWEESQNLLVDRVGAWMEVIADRGVSSLAIKPHRGHAMSTPTNAIWILKQLGEPKEVRMVYDYSHYAFRDIPLDVSIDTSLPWTSYIAVKDAVQSGDKVSFALAGSSKSWDMAEIVGGFHEGGYRGAICCEVSSQIWRKDPNYDAVQATKVCYKNMADAFDRAGVPRA